MRALVFVLFLVMLIWGIFSLFSFFRKKMRRKKIDRERRYIRQEHAVPSRRCTGPEGVSSGHGGSTLPLLMHI